MDVAGLEGKDYTDKYETEAYKQRLMSKEQAMIKASKQSCITTIQLPEDGHIKNNDKDFKRTTEEIRDKMIKDAINMYENKVKNENASPSKETKLKRTIRD